MAKRNTPVGMTCLGLQTISLANSTALGLNSTCIGGKFFHYSIETNSARLRTDGTSPTLNTGILLATGEHWLFDIKGSTIKFQRQTGTCKISIESYKYVGE